MTKPTRYHVGDAVHGAHCGMWYQATIAELDEEAGTVVVEWEDGSKSELGVIDIRLPPTRGEMEMEMTEAADTMLTRTRRQGNVRKPKEPSVKPKKDKKQEDDYSHLKVVCHTLPTPKSVWYSLVFLILGNVFFITLMITVPPSEDFKIWWGLCVVVICATLIQLILFLNNERERLRTNQTYIGGGKVEEPLKGDELAEVLERADQKVTQRHAMIDIVNTVREKLVDSWHNSAFITSIENCYKAAGFNKAADIIHDKSESEIDWYKTWKPLHDTMKTKEGVDLKVTFGSNMRQLYFHLGPGYLNGAMYGATPRPILHGKRQWVESFQNNPVEFRFKALSLRIRQACTEVAQFLGSDPDDTVLLTNQDAAFSSIIKSLPWECGDRLLAFDFGTVNTYRSSYKYLGHASGVFIDMLKIRIPISNTQILKTVKKHLKACKQNKELPIVAHFPHVTACTAFVLPVSELTEIFHHYGVSVIIDGNQAVGNIPVDLSQIKSDWYYGMLSRWLFAASGVAFLVTQPHKQKVTTTLTVAYSDGDGYVPEFGYTGLQDWSSFFTCIDSLDFINKICGGFGTIFEYNSSQAVRAVETLTKGWKTECLQGTSSKFGSMPIVFLPGGELAEVGDEVNLTEYLMDRHNITAHFLFTPRHNVNVLSVRCCCQVYTEDSDWVNLRDAILELVDPTHPIRQNPYSGLEININMQQQQLTYRDSMGRTLAEIDVIEDSDEEEEDQLESLMTGSIDSIPIIRKESYNEQGIRREIYRPTYTNIINYLVMVAPPLPFVVIPAMLLWGSLALFIILLGVSKPSDEIDVWKCCVAYLAVAVCFVSYADQAVLKKKRKLRKYQPRPKDVLLRKGMANKMAKLIKNREKLSRAACTSPLPNLQVLGSKIYRPAGKLPIAHNDPNRPLIEWNTRWQSLGTDMLLRSAGTTKLKVSYGSNVRRLYFRHEKGYINGASYGATPIPVIEAQYKWMKIIQQNPWEWRFKNLFSRLREVEVMIAEEINSHPDDTKLMTNANAATSTVLKSIAWKDSDRILIFDVEYDATKLAVQWLSRRHGVKVITMKVKLPITDDQICSQLKDYLSEIRDRNSEHLPFLANFCHITSKTAYQFPVKKLTQILHSFGCLVMVDGAQAVGQISVDVKSYGCDWYCGTLHKWMYTCPGVAFLVSRKEKHSETASLIITPGNSGYDRLSYQNVSEDVTSWVTALDARDFMQYVFGGIRSIRKELEKQCEMVVSFLQSEWGTTVFQLDSNNQPHYNLLPILPLPKGRHAKPIDAVKVMCYLSMKHDLTAFCMVVPITESSGKTVDTLCIRCTIQMWTDMEDWKKLARAIKNLEGDYGSLNIVKGTVWGG